MPAVHWETILQEAQALVASSGEPQAFLAQWEALLTRYANRALRPSQTAPPSLLPAYHIAPAVFGAVWQALRAHLLLRPEAVLPLADALWEHPALESRLLAARLLGIASPDEEALQRFWAWLESAPPPVQQALLQHSAARLIAEAPRAYLDALAARLADPAHARLALLALQPLLTDPAFENLPRVFRLITPLLEAPHPDLRPELAVVLQEAARRWHEETAPYLRRLWLTYPNDTLAWLIRRALPAFPPEQSTALRAMLQA